MEKNNKAQAHHHSKKFDKIVSQLELLDIDDDKSHYKLDKIG